MRKLLFVIWMVCGAILVMAQDVRKEPKADVNRSAGIYYALPPTKTYHETPAPAGKKPFYINHYGCPASFYLEKPDEYRIPINTLAKADSLGKLTKLGSDVLRRLQLVHLRYTNNNVVLSLASLMELDDCGVQTTNLDSLEHLGWVNYRIAPLGGRIEMIHYRSGQDDKDPLVKVLLNGREARLPIETDCAPYYHWTDFRRYCMEKLEK